MYGLKDNSKVFIEGYSDVFNNNHLNSNPKFIGTDFALINDSEYASVVKEFEISSIFYNNSYNIGFGNVDFVDAVKENIIIKHNSIDGKESIIDLNTSIIPNRTGLFDDGYMIISFNHNGKVYELDYTDLNNYPLATGELTDSTIALIKTPSDWNTIGEGVEEIISTYNGKIIESTDDIVVKILPEWKNQNLTFIENDLENYIFDFTSLNALSRAINSKTINIKCDLKDFVGFDSAFDGTTNYNFTLNLIGIDEDYLVKNNLMSKVENMKTHPGININFLPEEHFPEEASLNWVYTVSDLNNIITLKNYIGEDSNVVVRNSYRVNNKDYKNVILGRNGSNSAFYSKKDSVKSISFEKGVKANAISQNLFASLSSLEHIDLRGLDTSQTSSMAGFLGSCTSLKSVDLSNLDTSSVTDMRNFFNGNHNLEQVNLSNIDTSSVKYMGSFFYGCELLADVDLSSFNTSSLINMDRMFYNCSLSTIDLGTFDMSGITSTIVAAFDGCDFLETIYVKDEYAKTKVEASTGLPEETTVIIKGTYIEDASINWNYTVDDESGTITLNEYIGESTDVVVRNFYEADGNYYSNVVLGKNGSDGPFQSYYNTLKSISVEDGVKAPVDSSKLFAPLRVLESIDVKGLDVSETENMQRIFGETKLLETVDLSTWDTSNVKDMSSMFNGSGVKTLDLSNFDTSNVTTLYYFLSGASNLKSLNVDGWDVSKVSNMNYAFYYSGLESLDLSSWNTESLTSMNSIFENMTSLTSLNVDGWNISGVSKLTAAFRNSPLLEEIDISTWDTSNITNWDAIIYGCTNLKTLYVKDDNAKSSIESTYYEQDTDIIVLEEASTNWAFTVDNSTNTITLTSYTGESNDVKVRNCYLDNGVIYNNVELGPSSSNSGPFYSKRTSITSIDCDKGVKLPSISNSMFYKMTALTSLNINDCDASSITDMSTMFNSCSSLSELDLNNLDVSSVKNMSYLFGGCSLLESLNVKDWDTSSCTSIKNAFNNCYVLSDIDLSDWNVSSVTTMQDAFNGCKAFTNVDLSGWSIPSSADVRNMFVNCIALTTVYAKDSSSKTIIENSLNFPATATVVVGSPS